MNPSEQPEWFVDRMFRLWDGYAARGWGDRVGYWLLLFLLLSPMPTLLAFGGGLLFGFWGMVAGIVIGGLLVAGVLTGVAGNAMETGCFVIILYVLVVIMVLLAWKVRHKADQLRERATTLSRVEGGNHG